MWLGMCETLYPVPSPGGELWLYTETKDNCSNAEKILLGYIIVLSCSLSPLVLSFLLSLLSLHPSDCISLQQPASL